MEIDILPHLPFQLPISYFTLNMLQYIIQIFWKLKFIFIGNKHNLGVLINTLEGVWKIKWVNIFRGINEKRSRYEEESNFSRKFKFLKIKYKIYTFVL